MLNLKDFLESNQESMLYQRHETDDKKLLLKVFNKTKELIYVFKDDFPKSSEFNPFKAKKLSFLGVYDSINKKFYFENWHELYLLENNHKYNLIDISGLDYSDIETLLSEITDAVNNKIIEKIDNDENKLNVNLDEIRIYTESSKSNAVRSFLKGEKINTDSYAYFKMDVDECFEEFLIYMKDKNKAIEVLANSFISKNKNKIYTIIVENKVKENHIKTISNDKKYIMIRDINNVLLNKNLKTLNIKYKKDENEMTFKIDSTRCSLDNLSDTIYSSNIISPKDRELFEKTFKDEENYYGDILPKYIVEITHSRNVYYKNDNLN